MNPESDVVSLGEEQLPNFPTCNSNIETPNNTPNSVEEIDLKESIVVEVDFVNGRPVQEEVVKRIEIDVEGNRYQWHKETITALEIATLGGWSLAEGVLHIDADNNERTLKHEEEDRIEIGVSFAKKVRFKRG